MTATKERLFTSYTYTHHDGRTGTGPSVYCAMRAAVGRQPFYDVDYKVEWQGKVGSRAGSVINNSDGTGLGKVNEETI